MSDTVEVYRFPNGFGAQADSTIGWLRHASLNPKFASNGNGDDMTIRLPANEVACLRLMQKAFPARWGNAPKFENGSLVRVLTDTHGVRHKRRVGSVVRKSVVAGLYLVQMTYRLGPLVVNENDLEQVNERPLGPR
jgi:hypothetical protein